MSTLSKSSCLQGCWNEAQKVLKLGKREYITFLFTNKQRITKRRGLVQGSKADGELGVWMPHVGVMGLVSAHRCEWSVGWRGTCTARAEARGRNTPGVSEEQHRRRESWGYWVTPSLTGPCKHLSSWSEWDGGHSEEAYEEDRV